MDVLTVEAQVLRYNKLAMDALKFDNFKESFDKLKKAEELLDSDPDLPNSLNLLSVTYNNLGCHYKRRKQLKVALEFMQRALNIEKSSPELHSHQASTHLNMSAICSSISRHKEALWHAQQALAILKQSPESDLQSRTSVVIAYFNAAAELEHLQRWEDAADMYKVGWEHAIAGLGPAHPLTNSISQAFKTTRERSEALALRNENRVIKRNLSKVSPHVISRRFTENHTRLPAISPKFTHVKTRSIKIDTPIRDKDFKLPQAIDHTKYLKLS